MTIIAAHVKPVLKVLLGREQIARRVAEMGAEITRDFEGEAVVLVAVLKGAAIFLSDLARNINLEAHFDFFGISSYRDRTHSTGEVKLTKDVDHSLEGKNVILVEDILDTGLTLTYLKEVIAAHKPKKLRVAALLDKPARRKVPIKADYVGFEIPNEFVVGYGLDYAGKYRNLADVCILPPELIEPEEG